nr:hypothetical protein StreXyl84_50480 [Streptomyces sp. Xyl84]
MNGGRGAAKDGRGVADGGRGAAKDGRGVTDGGHGTANGGRRASKGGRGVGTPKGGSGQRLQSGLAGSVSSS